MRDSLIYDWNVVEPASRPPLVMFDDETLRDGLQSPSVRAPSIEQRLQILHLIDAVGIDTADIGLPGAGPHVVRDVERLAREIADSKMSLQANCAARTMISDVQPIAEIVQRTGVPIECCCFIGSSPLRQFAEDWTVDYLLKCTDEAVSFAVKQGLKVMYVTEDTTRSDPGTLRRLFTAAIRAGASRICIADTVGHATPMGAASVVRFARHVIDELGVDVGIDWHGHRDRDLAVMNSIAALEAGASRVHGAALGIGERVGNTPLDLLLVNLVLMRWVQRDLTKLNELRPPRVGSDRGRRPGQLPGVRPRRLPHGDRRARRRGCEGVPQERPRPDGCRLFGRARPARRTRAGNRCRTDVGQVECRLLARAARDRAERRAGRPCVPPCESVVHRIDRG